MSNGNTTVNLTLKLRGQQAKQVLEQMNKAQERSAAELLKTNRYLEGVLRQQAQQTGIQARQYQQMNTLVQQQRSALTQTATQTQASLRTNQLLERVLQQQVRQSSQLSQQTKNQNRDYQLQVNMLRQQAAAAERLRQQLEGAGRAERNMANGRGAGLVGGVMGGYMAAKGVVGTPLERARSFETKIFDAATSVTGGYTNMNQQQIVYGNTQLSNYARNAIRQGHGTVDGIGDASGILGASGQYSKISELERPLIAIAKGAFAAGAAEQDIAQLVKQLKISGVAPERSEIALARAVKSGYLGGFELRDMASLLPQTLPFAAKLGYTGEKGVNMVTTHMQLARQFTGIPSQANDNMRDLYELLNQRHFRMAAYKFIKLKEGDPTMTGKALGLRGKDDVVGLNITKLFADNMLKGIDPLQTLAQRMDEQISSNKEYVSLQKQLDAAVNAKDIAAQERLKGALNVVGGAEMGNIFHNQQSLAGIMALMTGFHNGQFNNIEKKSWEDTGALERVFQAKSLIEPAKAHALEQETILATIKIYDQVKDTLGGFEGGLKDTMRANQALAASALAAAGVLAVLAGAGVGARMGGGLGGSGAGALAGAKKWFIRGAIPLTIGAGAYNVYETANDKSLNQYQKNVKEAGIVGGTGGAIVGAMVGAAAGSVVPVVGTAIGGLIGGALGY